MTQTEHLLSRLSALAKRTNRSPKTLASQILGSAAEIERLENGGSMTLAKFERVSAKLDELERA